MNAVEFGNSRNFSFFYPALAANIPSVGKEIEDNLSDLLRNDIIKYINLSSHKNSNTENKHLVISFDYINGSSVINWNAASEKLHLKLIFEKSFSFFNEIFIITPNLFIRLNSYNFNLINEFGAEKALEEAQKLSPNGVIIVKFPL